MSWIIELIVNAAVLLGLAYIIPSVKVRSFGTALGVALVIGLLNATIGALIRFPLNLVTLWLLSFLVRLFVTAIIIKITDKLFSGFEVRGFTTAIIIAVVMAVVGTILSF
jgi:putative membrane protein